MFKCIIMVKQSVDLVHKITVRLTEQKKSTLAHCNMYKNLTHSKNKEIINKGLKM
jgi:hypothetical protein